MRWREVAQRLTKIGFAPGTRSKHRLMYNCPCNDGQAHPVGVENHPSKEAYPLDYKRKLGPHWDDFNNKKI